MLANVLLREALNEGLNESPYEKVGKCSGALAVSCGISRGLNESPYEKVGKFSTLAG